MYKKLLIFLLILARPAQGGMPPLAEVRATMANHKPLIGLGVLAALCATVRWFRTPIFPEVTQGNLHLVTWRPLIEQIDRTDWGNLANVVGDIKSYDKAQFNIPIKFKRNPINGGADRAYLVEKGIPQDVVEPIFIYSSSLVGGFFRPSLIHKYRGHGAGSYVVHRYLERNIVNGVCVAFDYPTDWRAAFNCGQEKDVECLAYVYKLVAKQNPRAPIVLVGDCRGATAIINFVTNPHYQNIFQQLKAIHIESPSISFKEIAKTTADYYLPWLPLSRSLIYSFGKFWFPAYDGSGKDRTIQSPDACIPTMPIFISRLMDDNVASATDIEQMVKILHKNGNQNIYLFTAERMPAGENMQAASRTRISNGKKYGHGQISNFLEFQYASNAFFKGSGLPHEPQFAQLGVEYLDLAKQEAHNYFN